MIARKSVIFHKESGVKIDTPLLIPSFSSKGFVFDSKGNSEINKIYKTSSEFFTRACLVSAYDIHYNHIKDPFNFESIPEVFFLDSGGYEVSETDDFSAVVHTPSQSKEWNKEKYRQVLSEWPDEYPSVFISYDHPDDRKSLEEQLKSADETFSQYKNRLSLFLLKPEKNTEHTLKSVLKKVYSNIDSLRGFDIIGITEKEIGSSILDRMENIARFRIALDEASIQTPLHIFGALDPISVCLYFLSGAEIFDGLTWLRYSYHESTCIYPHNYGFINLGIQADEKRIRVKSVSQNIIELENIEYTLREYLNTKNFKKFGLHADKIEQALDRLETKVKGVK